MKGFHILAAAALLAACESPPDAESAAPMPDLGVEEAAETITPEELLARLSIIADDSMLGRNTPSAGLDMTADWIAAEFASFGLEPGNGDSYLQMWPYPLVGADWDASEIEVSTGASLAFGDDVSYLGASRTNGEFTGDLVVVSGNEGDPTQLGISGKHVLLVSQPAAGAGRGGRGGRGRGLAGADPLVTFRISALEGAEWTAQVEQRREATTRAFGENTFNESPPTLEVRDGAIREILSAAGVDLGALSGSGPYQVTEVPGVSMTVRASARILSDDEAPNVVGILPGSDPELSDEYVVFSAHIDHVGVNGARARPDSIFGDDGALLRVEMDSIFNGADDDGSGTVTIVQLAKAYASLETAPARSMVFLGVSGEEKGLLGSDWYASNPTVPIEGIVANLNADMVGRNWSDTVVVIGKEHSDLGETLNAVGAAHPELNMAPIDDIWPDQNFYNRSDHANFAYQGVPVLFFFTGTHEDYHQVSDHVDKIDFEKMSRIGKTMFYLGYEVANRPEPPQWVPSSYEEIVPDDVKARRGGG